MRKDTFTTTAGTGSQSITGVGFTPKGLLLWTDTQTVSGFAAGWHLGLGFGTSATARYATGCAGTDAVSVTVDGRGQSDVSILYTVTPGTSSEFRLDLTSLDADGFTITKPTNITGTLVHYVAFGGADLTCQAGTLTGLTTIGDLDVTSVGFDPDLVLLLTGERATTGTGQSTYVQMVFGAFDRSLNQWALSAECENNAPTQFSVNPRNLCVQRTDQCMVGWTSGNPPAVNMRTHIVSILSNGFRLHWDQVPGTAWIIGYLAIKGGQWKVGAYNKNTGGAPVSDDVTVGFQPRGVFLGTHQYASGTSTQNDGQMAIGAGDGTRVGCAWSREETNTLPTVSDRCNVTTKALRLATGASTVLAECDLDLAAVTNGFRTTWTTNNATAAQIVFIAGGDSPPSNISSAEGSAPSGLQRPTWR